MNIHKIAMQLLMLLAVLATIIMPSMAAGDQPKSLHLMKQKRVELVFSYVIYYHAMIQTNTVHTDEIV
jgi:hypothetical protein